MLFYGRIGDDGKLHLKKPEKFGEFIAQFKGRDFLIEAAPFDHQSNAQRKFFHLTCGWIAKQCNTGHTKDEIKAIAKFKGLPYKFDEYGEPHLGESRNCTREEYGILIDTLIQFAAEELHLACPDPRPKPEEDFDEIRKIGKHA